MTPRRRAIVGVLAVAGLSASLVQTLLIPIQPELPTLLGAPPDQTPWVITITLIAGAITTPVAGRLGDMYGKRRIMLALLILLALGCVISALSTSLVPMLIGRSLQGLGAGVIPLGIAILRDSLTRYRLGSSIALLSGTLGVGGALGLPLAGVVAEYMDWHALFWATGALALLSAVSCWLVVPASPLRTPGRLDVTGIVGLSTGVGAVMMGLSVGATWGWGDLRTVSFLIAGTVILSGWAAYELRTRQPLVDLRTQTTGPVLLTNLATLAIGFSLFASNVVFPQLLQLPVETGVGLGLSVVTAGLIIAPSGVMVMAMSPIAGFLDRRWGPKYLLVSGAAIIAVSYALALAFHSQAWQIFVVNLVFGIGVGLCLGAMPALIMGFVKEAETAAANGFNTLMRSLGTAIASAVVGSVLAASRITTNGVTGPSDGGFVTALLLGGASALIGLVLALCVRRSRGLPNAALPPEAL